MPSREAAKRPFSRFRREVEAAWTDGCNCQLCQWWEQWQYAEIEEIRQRGYNMLLVHFECDGYHGDGYFPTNWRQPGTSK